MMTEDEARDIYGALVVLARCTAYVRDRLGEMIGPLPEEQISHLSLVDLSPDPENAA